MTDPSRTNQELLEEISVLKQRIKELEQSESERKLAQEALQESETKLQAIFDIVGTGIMIIDKNTQIIMEANQTAIDMVGLPKERIIGQICHSLVCPAQAGKCPVKDLGQSVDHSERKLLCANGSLKDILKTVYPITISGTDCYIESFIDISERKHAEEALRESEGKHRAFIESLPIGLYRNTPGPQGRFIMVNTALARLHGFDSVEEFLSRNVLDLYVDPAQRKEISEELVEKGFVSNKEVMLKRKDGTHIWGSITARAIRDHEGEVFYFDGTVTDITDRKRMEKEILTLSITDQLTGLHNRRGFLSLAGQQLKLSERNKSGMLLFFADLDLLKWINDELGHEEGDKALIEAANIFRETFRTSDIIARLGGDEFAVLAIDIKETNPEVFTARMQQLINIRNNKENRRYNLSISMGCSYYDPENPCSIDELMARADKLMYEQKQNKKGLLLQAASL